MPKKEIQVILFQVEQLHEDLAQVIAQERWGGAATYVEMYNSFLEQAKQQIEALPLKATQRPKEIKGKGNPFRTSVLQKDVDRVALLHLRPLCGQLLAWLRREAK